MRNEKKNMENILLKYFRKWEFLEFFVFGKSPKFEASR